MFAPPGTLIAFAADIDQLALSGTGRNGIYTGALLKELRDRRRRVEDIFQAVREDVRNAVGDRQKPVEFTSLTRPCYLGGVYEWLRPFRDCPDCPWVVPLPVGRFVLGSDSGPASERPAHEVTIGEPFAIGRYEVTFAEWDACVADGGCKTKDDRGWGRGNRPVIGVSRDDATAYVRWLSARTGNTYRLPTEAEWEYAARAGTTTPYPWGDEIGGGHANCGGCGSPFEGQTAPVGSFAPNPFGLHDLNGNVWEWVEDCFSDGYVGAPRDGTAVVRAICRQTVLRGGSYKERAGVATSTFRGRGSAGYPREDFGFRVVRVLQ